MRVCNWTKAGSPVMLLNVRDMDYRTAAACGPLHVQSLPACMWYLYSACMQEVYTSCT